MRNGKQEIFSSINYGFEWVDDWYKFDPVAAEAAAKADRDARAKALKTQGFAVKKFRLANQLVSRGGIGSGHPHITLIVHSYGLNISAEGRQ